MLNRTELNSRLLSGALAALTVSILVVMASLTHAIATIAMHA